MEILRDFGCYLMIWSAIVCYKPLAEKFAQTIFFGGMYALLMTSLWLSVAVTIVHT